MLNRQLSLKNISLGAFILAIALLSQGCGLLEKSDQLAACGNLANNLFQNGSEVPLNNQELIGSDLAQSFTTGTATTISKTQLILSKQNDPNGNGTLTVSLQKDAAGVPDNINIASTSLPISQITQNNTATTLNFVFASKIALTANTKYWIRLSSNIAQQPAAGSLIKWMGSTNNPYQFGEAKVQDQDTGAWKNNAIAGTNFSGASHDLVFNIDCNQ
jgi:hypothetical protein